MAKINLGTVVGEKGDPFVYSDFTPEQLESLKGENATINGREAIEISEGANVTIANTANGIEISATGGGSGDSLYTFVQGVPNQKSDIRYETRFLSDGTSKTTLLPLLSSSEIPSDFYSFTTEGESPFDGDFYCCPRTGAMEPEFNFIINPKGELLFWQRTNTNTYMFQKVKNSKGVARYTYLELVDVPEVAPGYQNCVFVILDENFDEMDRVYMLKDSMTEAGHPVDSHEAVYLDDWHYLVTYYRLDGTTNQIHSHIQEQKNEKVIWEWDSMDYPELLENALDPTAQDPLHINAYCYHTDGNLLVSYRNMGLIKINRQTGDVMWVIGNKRIDFTGLTVDDACYHQHFVQSVDYDSSIVVFDNATGREHTRTIRYFLDEENMTGEALIFDNPTEANGIWGGTELVADKVYDIAPGNTTSDNYAFYEYDFETQTKLFSLSFSGGSKLYRTERDRTVTKITKRNNTPEPPTTIKGLKNSNLTSYVDLGVVPIADYVLELKYKLDMPASETVTSCLCGINRGNTRVAQINSSQGYADSLSAYYNASSNIANYVIPEGANKIVDVKIESSGITIDGAKFDYTSPAGVNANADSLFLYCRNTSGSPSLFSNLTLYSVYYKDSNVEYTLTPQEFEGKNVLRDSVTGYVPDHFGEFEIVEEVL